MGLAKTSRKDYAHGVQGHMLALTPRHTPTLVGPTDIDRLSHTQHQASQTPKPRSVCVSDGTLYSAEPHQLAKLHTPSMTQRPSSVIVHLLLHGSSQFVRSVASSRGRTGHVRAEWRAAIHIYVCKLTRVGAQAQAHAPHLSIPAPRARCKGMPPSLGELTASRLRAPSLTFPSE